MQVPQTRPSHASIITGRYPYEHGIRDNYSPPARRRHARRSPRSSEQHGLGHRRLHRRLPGLARLGPRPGLRRLRRPLRGGRRHDARGAHASGAAEEVVDARARLARRSRARGPSSPGSTSSTRTRPTSRRRPTASASRSSPYDGEVAYADAQLGRLARLARRRGACAAGTLVVVTSDHGEGLGDHGEDEHMFFVYDSTLQVPLRLLLAGPAAGRAPACAASSGASTCCRRVLELARASAAPPTSGASRAAVLQPGGRIPDNESYAESLYAQLHFGYAPLRALRGEGWKYIDAPRAELYRLAEDPGETRNLARRARRRSRARCGRGSRPTTRQPASAAGAAGRRRRTRAERLAALGYVGRRAGLGGTPSGVDPKDKIARGAGLPRADMREGAAPLPRRGTSTAADPRSSSRLRERRPPSFNVQYYLGRSLLERRRFAEAIPHLEGAAEMAPDAADPLRPRRGPDLRLPRRGLRRGRPDREGRSRRSSRRSTVAPANAELLRARGRLLLAAGRPRRRRARRSRRRARSTRASRACTSSSSNLYRNLGDLARARGRGAGGAAARPEVARGPRSPAASSWARSGARPRRRAAFREALRLAPDAPRRALLPGRGRAARGARRGRGAAPREAREAGARVPARPRDAGAGAEDGRGARPGHGVALAPNRRVASGLGSLHPENATTRVLTPSAPSAAASR